MKLLYFLCFIASTFAVTAQLSNAEFIISGAGNNVVSSVIQSTDKGFVIAGATNSFGAGNYDCSFIKLDSSGTLMWSKTLGGTGYERATRVLEANDLGYLLCGTTRSYGDTALGSAYIVKTDVNGNVLWTKTFGDNFNLTSASKTRDNGYIIVGDSYVNSVSCFIQLVKIDLSGNVIWSKIMKNAVNFPSTVIATHDGGYAIGGSNSPGTYDLLLIKTDSLGTIQWSKLYGGPGPIEQGATLIQTKDHGYVLAGIGRSYGVCCNYDMYVVKMDSAGGVKWSRTAGGTQNEMEYSYVTENHRKEIVVAGHTASFGAGGDVYLVKFDSAGICNMKRAIGYPGYEQPSGIIQTKDHGYVISGITTSFGSTYDMFIMKTDSNFTLGCADTTNGGTIKMGAMVTNYTYTVTTGINTYSSSVIVGNGGTISDPCTLTAIANPHSVSEITVFPNPFKNSLKIHNSYNTKLPVEIYDLLGTLIIRLTPESDIMEIDLSYLANGIYIVRSGQFTKKIIKD